MPLKRVTLRFCTAALAVVTLIFTAGPQRTVKAAASVQVIATGLDNPRGLAFGTDGALYVVEAGRGGTSTLCLPLADNPTIPRCYGPSGAVTRITGLGVQQRVLTGLPSLAQASGEAATGPHDIDFAFDRAWITVGLAANPSVRAPFEAAGIRLGSLVRAFPANGQWDYVVDISAYEATANPDGGAIDSNPYGLRVLSNRAVVTDAGANALLQISLDRTISTLAVFPDQFVTPPPPRPSLPMQGVPTSVTEGPDGTLYVGQLTGFPFPVGAANVFRVPRGGGTPVSVATGFTNIIDIAFNGPGALGYVLEHDADGIPPPFGPSTAGRLIRINTNGSQTVIAGAELTKPGGVAVGTDGALYVTNKSISAGTGGVLRIVP